MLFIYSESKNICSAFVLQVVFGFLLPFKQNQDYNFQFKTNKNNGSYNFNIEP